MVEHGIENPSVPCSIQGGPAKYKRATKALGRVLIDSWRFALRAHQDIEAGKGGYRYECIYSSTRRTI